MNTRTILLLAGAAGVAGVGYYFWRKQHPAAPKPLILSTSAQLAQPLVLTAHGQLIAIPPKPAPFQTPKDAISAANLQFTGIGTQALGNYARAPRGMLRRYR